MSDVGQAQAQDQHRASSEVQANPTGTVSVAMNEPSLDQQQLQPSQVNAQAQSDYPQAHDLSRSQTQGSAPDPHLTRQYPWPHPLSHPKPQPQNQTWEQQQQRQSQFNYSNNQFPAQQQQQQNLNMQMQVQAGEQGNANAQGWFVHQQPEVQEGDIQKHEAGMDPQAPGAPGQPKPEAQAPAQAQSTSGQGAGTGTSTITEKPHNGQNQKGQSQQSKCPIWVILLAVLIPVVIVGVISSIVCSFCCPCCNRSEEHTLTKNSDGGYYWSDKPESEKNYLVKNFKSYDPSLVQKGGGISKDEIKSAGDDVAFTGAVASGGSLGFVQSSSLFHPVDKKHAVAKLNLGVALLLDQTIRKRRNKTSAHGKFYHGKTDDWEQLNEASTWIKDFMLFVESRSTEQMYDLLGFSKAQGADAYAKGLEVSNKQKVKPKIVVQRIRFFAPALKFEQDPSSSDQTDKTKQQLKEEIKDLEQLYRLPDEQYGNACMESSKGTNKNISGEDSIAILQHNKGKSRTRTDLDKGSKGQLQTVETLFVCSNTQHQFPEHHGRQITKEQLVRILKAMFQSHQRDVEELVGPNPDTEKTPKVKVKHHQEYHLGLKDDPRDYDDDDICKGNFHGEEIGGKGGCAPKRKPPPHVEKDGGKGSLTPQDEDLNGAIQERPNKAKAICERPYRYEPRNNDNEVRKKIVWGKDTANSLPKAKTFHMDYREKGDSRYYTCLKRFDGLAASENTPVKQVREYINLYNDFVERWDTYSGFFDKPKVQEEDDDKETKYKPGVRVNVEYKVIVTGEVTNHHKKPRFRGNNYKDGKTKQAPIQPNVVGKCSKKIQRSCCSPGKKKNKFVKHNNDMSRTSRWSRWNWEWKESTPFTKVADQDSVRYLPGYYYENMNYNDVMNACIYKQQLLPGFLEAWNVRESLTVEKKRVASGSDNSNLDTVLSVFVNEKTTILDQTQFFLLIDTYTEALNYLIQQSLRAKDLDFSLDWQDKTLGDFDTAYAKYKERMAKLKKQLKDKAKEYQEREAFESILIDYRDVELWNISFMNTEQVINDNKFESENVDKTTQWSVITQTKYEMRYVGGSSDPRVCGGHLERQKIETKLRLMRGRDGRIVRKGDYRKDKFEKAMLQPVTVGKKQQGPIHIGIRLQALKLYVKLWQDFAKSKGISEDIFTAAKFKAIPEEMINMSKTIWTESGGRDAYLKYDDFKKRYPKSCLNTELKSAVLKKL